MQRLFLFLYQYRAFFLFVLLEVLSTWCIIANNPYQGAAFFNSSNYMAASILDTRRDISDYFGLKDVNKELARENAWLRKRLLMIEDSIPDHPDSTFDARFTYQPARVINNSVHRATNFITIDKGTEDGIVHDMAVINSNGIVGKVKAVSRHYATITSLLHPDLYVSSIIQGSGNLCSVKWGGKNPTKANLLYVPRHLKVKKGDTVITSGYNAIFPPGIPIGVICDVNIEKDATFYNIQIDLATNFSQLAYVYVIKDHAKQEIDSLEENTVMRHEQ